MYTVYRILSNIVQLPSLNMLHLAFKSSVPCIKPVLLYIYSIIAFNSLIQSVVSFKIRSRTQTAFLRYSVWLADDRLIF